MQQLERPEVREALEELEHRSHHGEPAEALPAGLLDLPVEGLDNIFFYRPGELVVAPEAAEETRDMLEERGMLRRDRCQRTRSRSSRS